MFAEDLSVVAGIEFVSISATLNSSVFAGLYGSLRVVNGLCRSFSCVSIWSFTIFLRTERPIKTD